MSRCFILFLLLFPNLLQGQETDTNRIINRELKEVSVNKQRINGTSYTSRKQLEYIPAILGEKDILKYLATMPGIINTGALDPGIYVRGGNSSENTFLVNDIEIANPDHLTGILSTFDPYVLGRSAIYKSGFPTKYNGSLSSYLNMFTETDTSKLQGEITAGLISSAVKARGAIGKKGTSFAASVRGSYLQHIARLYNRANGSSAMPAYSFYDGTFSLHSPLSPSWRLDGFGLITADQLKLEDDQRPLKWNTESVNIRLRHEHGDNYFTFKAGGRFKHSAGEKARQSGLQGENRTRSVTIEMEYNRPLSEKLQLTSGIKYEYSNLRFGNNQTYSNAIFNLYSGYAGLNYEISPQWNIDGGVNYQFYSGKTQASTWSPRLRTNFKTSFGNIWADYAQTVQYLSIYPFFTIKSPLDIYFPLGQQSRPAVCHQISLGADKQLNEHIYLYAALFWKNMQKVKDFTDGLKNDYSNLEQQLTEGKGSAKGIELDFIYNSDKIYFRANYTLSESWRQFDAINNGKKFHPPYDIKHNILANASWKFHKSWTLNFMWTYQSGSYATFPVGVSIAQDINSPDKTPQFIPIYGNRYNFKLPDNHRLDISASYYRPYKKLDLLLNIGIYNVYNQPNASFVYFKPEKKDTYYTRFTPQSRVLLPFIPYLSLTINW